ncbi:MAG: alkaline phosphatase family protein [Candidatus Bathyarchaeia archaeon]
MAESKLDGLVTPRYDGYCITNLAATVMSLLEASLPGRPVLAEGPSRNGLGDVRRVVLLLVDALSYRHIHEAVKAGASPFAELAGKGGFSPLTSTFPSTTVAALTSLGTGLTPQEHGLIEYYLYLKEYGLVANMLRFSPAVDRTPERLLQLGLEPKKLLGAETLHVRLRRRGVAPYVVTRERYLTSGLGRLTNSGAEGIPYVNAPDMFVAVRKLLEANRERRLYAFTYWDCVDGVAHDYGPDSEELQAELRSLAFSLRTELLEKLSPSAAEGTLFILAADHGQLTVSKEHATYLTEHSGLLQCLSVPPTGSPRDLFLHVRAGRAEELTRYVEARFKDEATLLDSREALKMGLLGVGKPRQATYDRIGEMLLLPCGNRMFVYPYTKEETEFKVKGFHGGLTEEEMLVPLLYAKL